MSKDNVALELIEPISPEGSVAKFWNSEAEEYIIYHLLSIILSRN